MNAREAAELAKKGIIGPVEDGAAAQIIREVRDGGTRVVHGESYDETYKRQQEIIQCMKQAAEQAYEDAALIVENNLLDSLAQNEPAERWLAEKIRARAKEFFK